MKKVIPQNSQAHSSLESGKTNDEGMVCEEETCSFVSLVTDMEFVKNFTPSDFQEKNFTPSISPNFNDFNKKKHKK